MTTAREVKKFVAPLLARHSDLVLVGRAIIVKPLHHVLRFVFLGRTGSAAQFRPRCEASALFHPVESFPLGLGNRLYRENNRLWLWEDADIQTALIEVVERDALPKLRDMKTFQDYVKFALPWGKPELRHYKNIQFLYSLAQGDLGAAQRVLADAPDAKIIGRLNEARLGLGDRVLQLGPALEKEDRFAIAALLREWEAYTVENLKLDHIWERAPFPLERV